MTHCCEQEEFKREEKEAVATIERLTICGSEPKTCKSDKIGEAERVGRRRKEGKRREEKEETANHLRAADTRLLAFDSYTTRGTYCTYLTQVLTKVPTNKAGTKEKENRERK